MLGKIFRQFGLNPGNGLRGSRKNFLDDHLCIIRVACLSGSAVEMPSLNPVHLVMTVFSKQGHGGADFMGSPMIGPLPHHRIDGHHIVQGRQPEATTRQELDAEIIPVQGEGLRRNRFHQAPLDIVLRKRNALDPIETRGLLVLVKDLDRTHTIPPDSLQKVERIK